jgi:hypothetical protein
VLKSILAPNGIVTGSNMGASFAGDRLPGARNLRAVSEF